MSKNLIPIVAKELGVEIGEDFEVGGSGQYRFTETTLEFKHPDGHYSPAVLSFNRLNENEIIKLPFEPKSGETYWTYAGDEESPYGWRLHSEVWDGAAYDYIHKASGCIFRTEEEAIEARPAKYKELTGREW